MLLAVIIIGFAGIIWLDDLIALVRRFLRKN